MTELAHPLRAGKSEAAGGPQPSAHDAGLRLAEASLKVPEACGACRLMLAEYGFEPPPELLAEFAAGGKAGWRTDLGKTAAEQIRDAFEHEYLLREPVSALLIRCTTLRADMSRADPWIALFNIRQSIGTGQENAALVVSGFLTAMGLDVSIISRHSQVMETSGLTIAYVKCLAGLPAWGVGMGGDLASASLKAVLSAVNRAGMLAAGRRGGERRGSVPREAARHQSA
jgi:2-isopropylmalate synthase